MVTLSIAAFSMVTLSIRAVSMMTLSLTAFSIDTQHIGIQHGDTQHNDIQHRDTQPNGIQHGDTQHINNNTRHSVMSQFNVPVFWYADCRYGEYRSGERCYAEYRDASISY